MISQLRDRYMDMVHPLNHLEIKFTTAKVRMKYIDRSHSGKKGAFRIHPRLPALQIWPDVQEGQRLLRALERIEDEIIQRIQLQERLRDAKEAIAEARSDGVPPEKEDWMMVQETQILSMRNDRSVNRRLEGRTITLSEIEQAINRARWELLRNRRTLPREVVEIQLKSDVPVKLKPTIEVRLWVNYE